MYDFALFLSIVSSILFIIFLLIAIFKRKEPAQTITIRGRIITQTVTTAYTNGEDVVTGRTIEQR